MYINQAFIDGVSGNPSPQYKLRMTIDSVELDVIDASFEFVADSFIGVFPSWKCVAKIDYNEIGSVPNYRNKQAIIEAGSVINEVVTYIPIGTFIVDENGQTINQNEFEVTLTMYDFAYYNFNKLYVPSVTYPCTGLEIINDIANQAGISLASWDELTLDSFIFNQQPNFSSGDTSLREMIIHYAMANLSVAFINRSGYLLFSCPFKKMSPAWDLRATYGFLEQYTYEQLASYTYEEIMMLSIDTSIYTLDKHDYDSSTTINDVYGPVNSIALSRSAEGTDETYDDVVLNDEVSISSNGIKQLKIEDNIFLDNVREDVIQSLFDLSNGFEYVPFNSSVFGRPDFEPGDYIIVKGFDESVYQSPLSNMTHYFNGGLLSTFKTVEIPETLAKTLASGSLTKKITRLSLQVNQAEGEIQAVAESVDAANQRIDDVELILTPNEFKIKVHDANTDIYGNVLDEALKSFIFNEQGLNINSSENQFSILISESKISFKDSGIETAYINNSEFNIAKGRINESLIVGNHKIEKLNTSMTVFRYIGE